eukprot:933613-Rhodomonas_salina.2
MDCDCILFWNITFVNDCIAHGHVVVGGCKAQRSCAHEVYCVEAGKEAELCHFGCAVVEFEHDRGRV